MSVLPAAADKEQVDTGLADAALRRTAQAAAAHLCGFSKISALRPDVDQDIRMLADFCMNVYIAVAYIEELARTGPPAAARIAVAVPLRIVPAAGLGQHTAGALDYSMETWRPSFVVANLAALVGHRRIAPLMQALQQVAQPPLADHRMPFAQDLPRITARRSSGIPISRSCQRVRGFCLVGYQAPVHRCPRR